jgi:monothiol glutaredoxin
MAFEPDAEPEMDPEAVRDHVDETIAENEVVLFMKGTELMPQCGYSRKAIALIQQHRDDVESVNVLAALDAYREALERHSGRETIPQAYVDGDFVGGSDILEQHQERGDLAETLRA